MGVYHLNNTNSAAAISAAVFLSPFYADIQNDNTLAPLRHLRVVPLGFVKK
jgi:hypothetical protein